MTTEPVTFSVGADTLSAEIVRPSGQGPWPAVILLPAIAGVNAYVRARAGKLAEAGYLTFVLDYYAREGAAPDVSTPEKIGAAVAGLSDVQVAGDIRAAHAWLGSQDDVEAGKVAALGFCIGGMFAFLAACNEPGLACAVNYYGLIEYAKKSEIKPAAPLDRADDLAAPVLCHFGDCDRLISADQIARLGTALRDAQKPYELYVYGGAPHAFDEDFRPGVYRPAAADEAWRRSLTFLDWHLKDQRNT